MSWLSDLFKKGKPKKNEKFNQAVSMKGYEPTFTSFGKNILQSDIVYSALKMKARFFGKLEPRHVRVDKEGKQQTIIDSSVARLLRNPNDFQTTYDFLTQAYFMREAYDNCFIYADYHKASNGAKIYDGMYILLPIGTPQIWEDESGKLFIKFQFVHPAREVIFPYEDIIHWKQNIEDNQFIGGGRYAGLSNADLINSLEAYHTGKEAVAEASKLGCYLDGILKINGYSADNEKVKKIRDEFIDDLKKNKSGIAVLDNGADFQNIQRTLKVMDSATLSEIKENVMLHTGVTIDMLSGKFSDEDNEAFYQNWIEPSAISLGQAMTKVFFSQWQTSYGDRVEIYASPWQLMSAQKKKELADMGLKAGIFSKNQALQLLGFPPINDPDGDARPRGYNNLDTATEGGSSNGEQVNEGN